MAEEGPKMGVLKFGAEGAGTWRFFIAWGYENLSGYRIKRRGAMNIFGIKKNLHPPLAKFMTGP